MLRSTLLDWISYFIECAAKDTNPARKLARIRALQSVKKIVAGLPNRVTPKHLQQAQLSEYMRGKLLEALKDGQEPPKSNATLLAEISGIGPVLAAKLDHKGVTPANITYHLAELPLEAQMNIKYKPMRPIPREYIDRFDKLLANHIDTQYAICGSYRRGAARSGDIDLLYMGDIQYLVDNLPGTKHIYMSGVEKISLLYSLPRSCKYVKVDVMRATPRNWGTYLLYLTGSKEHNILMRHRAKEQGLLLNQNGLYRGKVRLDTPTEQDVFNILGLTYRPPNER